MNAEEVISDALAKGCEVKVAGLPIAVCVGGELHMSLMFFRGEEVSFPTAVSSRWHSGPHVVWSWAKSRPRRRRGDCRLCYAPSVRC